MFLGLDQRRVGALCGLLALVLPAAALAAPAATPQPSATAETGERSGALLCTLLGAFERTSRLCDGDGQLRFGAMLDPHGVRDIEEPDTAGTAPGGSGNPGGGNGGGNGGGQGGGSGG